MSGADDVVKLALKLVFSGSKAVDEAGVPVRYYHGTTHDLPVVKPGTYFTEDPSEGSAYTFWTDLKNAEKHKGKYSIISAPELAGKRLEYFGTISDIDSPKVGEFYATDNGIMRYKGKGTWDVASDLGVDNGSLDMSDYTIGVKPHDNSEAAKQMVGEYEEAVKRAYPGGSGGNVIPAYLNVKNPKEMSPLEGNLFGERLGADPKWVADEIEKLKAQGYDSIVTTSDDPFYAVERKKPPKHYMIFEPTQAKSAIGNTGEYDFTNPDITKAYGGSIRQGYGPGGWVDDVVKMAGKAVMGEGDNVTRLSDVRSARETDALIKKIKSAVNLVKSGHFQAGRQALINQKSLDLHKSGMLPLQQGTIVTPPSTWDMPGDWRVSGYWYDEKDPRRFGYKLQNESGQTYDAAASDPRAGLRRDNPYSFGAGFKAYAGPNASPPKPVAPPVEKPATPKPPEVLDAINKEYEDLFGSEDPFKPRAHGGRIAKGPGGWLDDVVKMAGKVISGEGDDAAKAGIRAYQGSPHNFAAERLVRFPTGKEEYLVGQPDVLPDAPEGAEVLQDFPLGRMRMDKIGTGEGAQAYGHGLYLAEHEPVAQGYKDALRRKGDEITFDNAPLKGPHDYNAIQSQLENKEGDWRLFKAVDEITKRQGSMGDRLDDIRNWYRNQPEMLAAIDRAEKRMTLKENPGFVYETNINADRNTFLDWDKPLSEQPSLTRALGNYDPEYYVDYDEIIQKAMQSLQPVREPTGEDIYRALGHPKTATRMLNTMGVPGIRFLDAGSRVHDDTAIGMIKNYGSREKALEVAQKRLASAHHSDRASWQKTVDALSRPETRNLVVFDDKLISIIRKYGIAGASAMLGYNLMEQLDPKQALAASMADQDYQASRPQRSMGGNNSISGALNVARGLNGGE